MASYISTSYPETNDKLVKELDLMKHPEGGYFKETDRQTVEIPSPFAGNQLRSLSTSIYYLLTYEENKGKLHMNKSVTYHVLHQGRAEYTLITPGKSGAPPKIEKKIMGADVRAGETRLLIVGGGVWKMSEIPKVDLEAASSQNRTNRTGCLITEVVTPGFHWDDHVFLTAKGLAGLFEDDPKKEEKMKEYISRVKNTD